MADILECSHLEFNYNVYAKSSNEQWANVQEQVGNVHWEMDTLGKNQKETLEVINIVTEMKNGSSVNYTQPRKELKNLKICQ